MKSKCSFILKASTALVLALLMLFGTVTTSLAAVADNLVDTGAQADLAETGAWFSNYCIVGDAWGWSSRSDDYHTPGTSVSYDLTSYIGSNTDLGVYLDQYFKKTSGGSLSVGASQYIYGDGGNNANISINQGIVTLNVKDEGDNGKLYYVSDIDPSFKVYNGNTALTGAMTHSAGSKTFTTTTTLNAGTTYSFSVRNSKTTFRATGSITAGTAKTFKAATTSGTVSYTAPVTGTYSFSWVMDSTDGTREGALTITAPVTYTVSYNANGHGTAPSSEVVISGGKATEPTAPTATGYTFGGWYKETACTNAWNFSTDTVTQNRTLYAKWTEKKNNTVALTAYTDGSASTAGGVIKVNNTAVTSIPTNTIGVDSSATAVSVANTSADYEFKGWQFDGSNYNHLKYRFSTTGSWVTPSAKNTTVGSSSNTTIYIKTDGTSGLTTADAIVKAMFVSKHYITLYNTWMQESVGKPFVFVASPPKQVVVKSGNTVRATYTYANGTAAQRGEDHTVESTGTYYEGNKLLVYPGETVTLKYSNLASSDAIRGVFFNNERRYTHELEDDNLYYKRTYKAGGYGEPDEEGNYEGLAPGEVPDDEWDYTYEADTTLYAEKNYYISDQDAYDAIAANEASYDPSVNVDNSTHEVSWTVSQNYYNIDLELDNKYQLHINNDDDSYITIANINEEGYYFGGEVIESTTPNHTNGLKITLKDSSKDFFTGTTATFTDAKGVALDPQDIPDTITVKAYKSNNTEATTASEVDHFLIYGTMPNENVYIKIPVVEKYRMRLANIVVADNGNNKRTMLTETTGSATTSTGNIGTISTKLNGVSNSAIASDGNHYTYPGQNHADQVNVYENSTNNKYLKGGVNKSGTLVEVGSEITYTFTFESGKDAEYSFVGWFEGTLNNTTFYPDYTKKLSGLQTYKHTVTKDTIIMAVATKDVYIGGNFTDKGVRTTTAADQTYSKNRPIMIFDPTYVKPNGTADQKGRYYYTFNTITPNEEYDFRCYDTASGTDTTNLALWKAWTGSDDYAQNNNDILFGRDYYGGNANSHGQFIFKDSNVSKSLSNNTDSSNATSTKNHASNGYGTPVTVYFYAYDGGITVESTYQWSMAYVSEGRGIDVKNPSWNDETAGKYNIPTASVANKTVNNKDVVVTPQATKYGANVDGGKYEKIYECLVKEKDGQIKVTAMPNDVNVELEAFVVYNIETKKSEAVKTFTTSGEGAAKQYIGNIKIPNNSKIYVCPVYKFTDKYISDEGLESHKVFVRADDIDKDDWGGLISMYSWGTTQGYNSGGWPGQLMIPSDDGDSFYAPLTFIHNALAGVNFTNYTKVWGGKFVNFLGTYQEKNVSDVAYSGYTKASYNDGDVRYIYQGIDYREPISIIDNINEVNPRIYDSEDMTLTFALKKGNKTSATVGNGAYNASFDYEYLTDSSGKNRVDLNGNKLTTNATATYYVVCNYTEAYKSGGSKSYDFVDGDRDGTSTHNMYSVDWNVYDTEGNSVVTGKLSAGFTDVYKTEMMTYIAKKVFDAGYPVSGKAVKIAYENPKISSSDNTEAVRYSGQWYADSINTIIKGNVRVGLLSDGKWIASDTNDPGYAIATVEFSPNAEIGESYETEDDCSGNSLANVTKVHASNGDVQFRVSSTTNFLGWYRMNDDGTFDPVGTNYQNQAINPSFNEDITYYAFYSGSAFYNFRYTGRDRSTKIYSVEGSDLTKDEMTNGGILDIESRASDIQTRLAKVNQITVFNHSLTYDLENADNTTPYTISFNAGDSVTSYNLTVWSYDSSGELKQKGSVSGTWSKALDVTNDPNLGNGTSLVNNKPSDKPNSIFIGWKKKGDLDTNIISTQANFGYSITQNTVIEPVFGSARIADETWKAGIDKNVITQELTNSSTGTIYNDTLVSFKYATATGEQFDLNENECGLIVVSQTGEAAANNTYSNNFTNIISNTKMQGYLDTLDSRNTDAAKLSSSVYGEAYVQRIKVDSLSRLNRADLYQILDYSKFNNGQYKIMSYAKVGGTTVFSDLIANNYTNGQKYPIV